jgi:hypothetical protein
MAVVMIPEANDGRPAKQGPTEKDQHTFAIALPACGFSRQRSS